jgi:hypothetical protein
LVPAQPLTWVEAGCMLTRANTPPNENNRNNKVKTKSKYLLIWLILIKPSASNSLVNNIILLLYILY